MFIMNTNKYIHLCIFPGKGKNDKLFVRFLRFTRKVVHFDVTHAWPFTHPEVKYFLLYYNIHVFIIKILYTIFRLLLFYVVLFSHNILQFFLFPQFFYFRNNFLFFVGNIFSPSQIHKNKAA